MKYGILKLLKETGSDYITGVDIGTRFGISRSAVWKHIIELRNEGYDIESSPNKGYRLLPGGELLNPFEIMDGLGTKIAGTEVVYFDEIASTNTHAAKLAADGCAEGTAVVAGTQTTAGEDWAEAGNPEGQGYIPFNYIKAAHGSCGDAGIHACGCCGRGKAIYDVTGLRTGIKWPNDIIYEGKNQRILLEMNSEAEMVNWLILGIGVNYSQTESDFPEEIRDRAVSILSASGEGTPWKDAPHGQGSAPGEDLHHVLRGGHDGRAGRLALIRALLRRIDDIYQDILNGKNAGILDEWRKHSVTLGREVRFTLKNTEYTGTAADIIENGSLLVDCSDGVRRELHSGEISIRGIFGYSD